MNSQYLRVPLSVEVRFDADGQMIPLSLNYCDCRFFIDKVLSSRKYTPNIVPCRFPVEYTVMIEGYKKKIYYEKYSNKWFSIREFHANLPEV